MYTIGLEIAGCHENAADQGYSIANTHGRKPNDSLIPNVTSCLHATVCMLFQNFLSTDILLTQVQSIFQRGDLHLFRKEFVLITMKLSHSIAMHDPTGLTRADSERQMSCNTRGRGKTLALAIFGLPSVCVYAEKSNDNANKKLKSKFPRLLCHLKVQYFHFRERESLDWCRATGIKSSPSDSLLSQYSVRG